MALFSRRNQLVAISGERLPSTIDSNQEDDRQVRLEILLAARRSRVILNRLLGLLIVVVPTVLSAVYCFYFAAPMYQSSSRFAIRAQSEAGSSSTLGKIMQGVGAGPTGALTDGFAVRDYLSSGDALHQLDEKVGFVKRMEEPRGDFFIELKRGESNEAILDFYHRVVKVRFNMVEGIVTLDTYAFTPGDAYTLAKTLTAMAGEFSNNLNRNASEETVRVSREELKRAESRLASARLALNDWRKLNQSLDVEVSAKMIQNIIAQLEVNLSDTRNELEQLRNSGLQNSPRRPDLENRIRTLTQQIAAENARLTSAKGDASVVNLLGDYQRLNLEQEFASKAYEQALQALSNAQAVASIQQKFVAEIVAPLLPQKPTWPDSPKIIALTFLASAFTYLLGLLAISVIRDNARS